MTRPDPSGIGFKYWSRAWALFVPTGCAGSVVIGARTKGTTPTRMSPLPMVAAMGSAKGVGSSAAACGTSASSASAVIRWGSKVENMDLRFLRAYAAAILAHT